MMKETKTIKKKSQLNFYVLIIIIINDERDKNRSRKNHN